MLRWLAGYNLRTNIEKANRSRKRQFVPWDQIEKIALIVQKDENLNKSMLDNFIADSRKYIEVYCVELNSKVPSFGDWRCLYKKDRSPWLQLPSKAVVQELQEKNFDVVINTCSDNNLFSASLTSIIPASFKCAPSVRYNYADLVIERRDPYHLLGYLEDIVSYLKMIRLESK
jgi:hypothetical protein